jgi:pimeloyl-ACP methyl ester carboxylesterase
MNHLLIFAPGWSDPHLVVDRLARKFDNNYDKLVLTYPSRGVSHSIREAISSVEPVVRGLRQDYEYVSLIGHSMGGLVGRGLYRYLDNLITIGTPHQGTRLAALGPKWLTQRLSPSAIDMAPGSDFLREIKNFWPLRSLGIIAGWDPLVWPSSSAYVTPGGEKIGVNKKAPWTEHVSAALCRKTINDINEFLDL